MTVEHLLAIAFPAVKAEHPDSSLTRDYFEKLIDPVWNDTLTTEKAKVNALSTLLDREYAREREGK